METRLSNKKRINIKHNIKSTSSKSFSAVEMSENEVSGVFGDEMTGYILSHTPPIVERILEHLPMPILNNCACVCKLWNSIVQAIKRRRSNILWMFKVQASGQDNHINPSDPKHAVFATKRAHEIGDHFHETLKSAFCEPRSGIVFCVEQITQKPKKYFRKYASLPCKENERKDQKRKRLPRFIESCSDRMSYREPFVGYLSRQLPKKCNITCCITTGLVGTPVDLSTPVELELSVGLTSLFFPTIPGLETYHFSITDNDVRNYLSMQESFGDQLIDDDTVASITSIPKDKEVKCLLIFLDNLPQPKDLTCAILEHYIKKQKYRIALGGALVDQVVSSLKPKDNSEQIAVGVAFVGDAVKAASLVLEPSIRKPQQVLEKLKELQACNFPVETSVAFMFACCGRGTTFYHKPNVEAETFRKLFPMVPLFGLFGNGEIGNDFFPNSNMDVKRSASYKDWSRPHWFHGYTTIFIVLSWSKK